MCDQNHHYQHSMADPLRKSTMSCYIRRIMTMVSTPWSRAALSHTLGVKIRLCAVCIKAFLLLLQLPAFYHLPRHCGNEENLVNCAYVSCRFVALDSILKNYALHMHAVLSRKQRQGKVHVCSKHHTDEWYGRFACLSQSKRCPVMRGKRLQTIRGATDESVSRFSFLG
jgi:hypothetical protein